MATNEMLYWLILMGILLAAEMFSATIALLFAGLGALAAALIANFFPDSFRLQITVFAVASLVGVYLYWRQKYVCAGLHDMADDAIGQMVEVVPEQFPGQLRVRYSGSEWVARFANPSENTSVKLGDLLVIQGRAGSTLLVATRDTKQR
jgi:membrane protein implicated in regulation of membrane protease activity